MPRRGFTLIELMIVVAIIGVLASIAIPKFADLLRKSSEGASKGSLGAVRSALSIYYSDMEGVYPDELESLTLSGKYAQALPVTKTPPYHADTGAVQDVDDLGASAMLADDNGAWRYWNSTAGSGGRTQGDLFIGCVHTDSKSRVWTTY